MVAENVRDAVRLLGKWSPGAYNVRHLAGPKFSNIRREIMDCLNGGPNAISKCGVNAVEAALAAAVVPGAVGCMATVQYDFVRAAKRIDGCIC